MRVVASGSEALMSTIGNWPWIQLHLDEPSRIVQFPDMMDSTEVAEYNGSSSSWLVEGEMDADGDAGGLEVCSAPLTNGAYPQTFLTDSANHGHIYYTGGISSPRSQYNYNSGIRLQL